MANALALFLAVVAVVYTDLDSGNFWLARALPLLFVICLFYLLQLRGFMIVLTGSVAGYYTDFNHTSLFFSVFLPFVVVVCILYFVIVFGVAGGGSGMGGDGGWDGGDGGGCD
jgi:hypothetical protein